MVHMQNTKCALLIANATAATSATTSARVDTLGFEYAVIEAMLPKTTATNSSAKWGALKVTHGDSTAVSSASAIYNLTGTTNTVTDATNGYVIAATNDTAAGQTTKLFCDMRGKGRYLFAIFQAPDSHSTVTIKAELGRPQTIPDTASERGVGVAAIG